MKEMIFGKVRSFALQVIEISENYYSEDLLDLLSRELLNVRVTSINLYGIGDKIDDVRFLKESRFARMVDMPYHLATKEQMRKLKEKINSNVGDLPDEQAKKKEIRFLSDLAQMITSQEGLHK